MRQTGSIRHVSPAIHDAIAADKCMIVIIYLLNISDLMINNFQYENMNENRGSLDA